jgi:[ribosomal protein S5]-alanine N-acetyltransferase
MPVITETERLVLRTWESDDALDAFAIWGDPEVMRYVGAPLADLDSARRTLDRAADAQQRHGVSLWAVVEKASGEVIGACGFHFLADGPELELAYHFKQPFWGRSFATEAASACVFYATETLGATKISAGVGAGNAASRRVLEKVGFHYERLDHSEGVDEEWFSIPSRPM